ncbi:MAG: hypothetical protein OXL37_08650 [Chloroflexota bacterium]|nr:hypothetical protein [Chloroflexota bacterium]MDE2959577.1 hypothetical protein [Chloroflexota bacterium]
MAVTVTECAQEMVKAYNRMVSEGFAAARVGWEQSAATTKLMTEAFQAEQAASGKIWEESIGRARERSEKMAELTKTFAAAPNVVGSPEARELIDAIVAGDQEYLRACAEYAQGVEKRRAELTATMLKANTDLASAGQDMVDSAMDYGRACMDWSFAVGRGASPTAPF